MFNNFLQKMKRERTMKKTLLLAGIASLVAFNVSATEYLPYVAARVARVEVKNNITTSVIKEKINDDQYGYRIAGGVMVPFCGGLAQSVRAEVEYGLLNKTHNTVGDALGLQTQLQTVLANVYYDLDTGTAVTPYLGVGVGYARIEEKAWEKTTEDNLAWNIGVGVSVNLTYNMDVEVGYRYTDYGKSKSKVIDETVKRNYDSQEVLLGLRYTF